MRQWGTNGRWNGQFHYRTDVAVGPTGEVFVADAYNHRIQAFTDGGAYLTKWGGLGYEVRLLNVPLRRGRCGRFFFRLPGTTG